MSKGKDALIALTLAHAMTLGFRSEYGYQKSLHYHTAKNEYAPHRKGAPQE